MRSPSVNNYQVDASPSSVDRTAFARIFDNGEKINPSNDEVFSDSNTSAAFVSVFWITPSDVSRFPHHFLRGVPVRHLPLFYKHSNFLFFFCPIIPHTKSPRITAFRSVLDKLVSARSLKLATRGEGDSLRDGIGGRGARAAVSSADSQLPVEIESL